MNQVQLIGRLAREVTPTEISEQPTVINNVVAVNRKGKIILSVSTLSQLPFEWDG